MELIRKVSNKKPKIKFVATPRLACLAYLGINIIYNLFILNVL